MPIADKQRIAKSHSLVDFYAVVQVTFKVAKAALKVLQGRTDAQLCTCNQSLLSLLILWSNLLFNSFHIKMVCMAHCNEHFLQSVVDLIG